MLSLLIALCTFLENSVLEETELSKKLGWKSTVLISEVLTSS